VSFEAAVLAIVKFIETGDGKRVGDVINADPAAGGI